MTLKDKDIKLLIKLFENSKKSNRQLAKECELSKETVASKIQTFQENGYIKSYLLKINYELLGFERFDLFLRLRNVTSKCTKEIINFLEKHINVIWIGKSFGRYDIKFSVILKNGNNINKILATISSKFGENIDSIDSLFVVESYKAPAHLYLNRLFDTNISQLNKSFDTQTTVSNNNLTLDKIDKKILYFIGQNPKESYVNIGLKLKMTAEAIKYRTKKLEKSSIIQGHSVVFNCNKFNKVYCQVLLNINPESINKVKQYLKGKFAFSSYIEVIGIWNLSVNFFANNIEQLYENLNMLRSDFTKEIRNFEFLIFFDIYKYPKLPECILD